MDIIGYNYEELKDLKLDNLLRDDQLETADDRLLNI